MEAKNHRMKTAIKLESRVTPKCCSFLLPWKKEKKKHSQGYLQDHCKWWWLLCFCHSVAALSHHYHFCLHKACLTPNRLSMRCLGLTLWQVIRFISILSCMTIHCSVLAHNMAKASCPVSIWMSSWEQWIPRHLHIAYLFGKSLLCAMCVCWHAWRHIWMGHSSCALQCNLQVPGNFTLVWHLPPLNLARQIHSGAHCDHPVRSVELSGPHYTFM